MANSKHGPDALNLAYMLPNTTIDIIKNSKKRNWKKSIS
jgi:hypothetical protein